MDCFKLHNQMAFHSISMKGSKITISAFHNPLNQSHLIETYTSKAHVHSLVIRLSSFVILLLLRPAANHVIPTAYNNWQCYLNQGTRLLCKILFSFPRSRRGIWRRNISNRLNKNVWGEWMILYFGIIAWIDIDFDYLTGLQFQRSKRRLIFMYNNEWYCLLRKSPTGMLRRKGFTFIIYKDTLKIDRLSSPLTLFNKSWGCIVGRTGGLSV